MIRTLPAEETARIKALWEALSEDAKLVLRAASLFNAEAIPADALAALFDAADWDKEQFEAACDEARRSALLIAEGEGFRMPLPIASFVAGKAEPELPEAMLEAHVEAFVAAANLAEEQPSEAGPAARLFAYPLHPEAWELLGEAVHAHMVHGAIYSVTSALSELGRDDQALAWYKHGVRWFERAIEQEVEGSKTAANLHAKLGELLSITGMCRSCIDDAEALSWFERALIAFEKANEEGRVNRARIRATAFQIAECHARCDRLDEAAQWFERAVSEQDEQRQDDAKEQADTDIGEAASAIGHCLIRQNRHAEAIQWFERSVDSLAKWGEHDANRPVLVGTFQGMAIAHCSMNQHQDSMRWAMRGAELCAGAEDQFPVFRPALVECARGVGLSLRALERDEEAIQWFERVIEAIRKGDEHGTVDQSGIGNSLIQIGECHYALDRYEKAIGCFERAIEAHQKGDEHGQVDHECIGTSLEGIARSHFALGRHEAAIGCFERAIEAYQKGDKHGNVHHLWIGANLYGIGQSHFELGRHETAIGCFERAIEACQKGDAWGPVDYVIGASLHLIGRSHFELGRHEAAIGCFERAVGAYQKGDTFGKVDHHEIADNLRWIGECLRALGRTRDALDSLERAVGEAERGDGLGRVKPERIDAIRAVRDELRAVCNAASQR